MKEDIKEYARAVYFNFMKQVTLYMAVVYFTFFYDP